MAVAGIIASLALAAPASAAPSSCSTPPSTRPFALWGDANPYFLAKGGDFESTSGWSLSGGARLVAGSEPWAATGRLGRSSLSLPAGAAALSPVLCLTPDNPTVRFFQRVPQGPAAALRADAIVVKASPQVIGLGAVRGTVAWSPSAVLASGVNDVLWNAKGTVRLRLRFTAVAGSWTVDDLFVDPQKRG
jgi:hypothetical protein